MDTPELTAIHQALKELVTQAANQCRNLDTLDLVYRILITDI